MHFHKIYFYIKIIHRKIHVKMEYCCDFSHHPSLFREVAKINFLQIMPF